MPVVFILSLFDTGLVTGRLFVKKGYQVLGFDSNPAMPGFRTRLFPVHLAPALTEEKKLTDFLIGFAKQFPDKPLLIPGSDAYTALVLNNYNEFKEHFQFALSEKSLATTLLNKQGQYELLKSIGVLQAESRSLVHSDMSVKDLEGMKFPLLFKPLASYPWKSIYQEKALEAGDKETAEKIIMNLISEKIDVIVQEIIPGEVTNNIETAVFVTQEGLVSPVFCYRKLRQYPSKYGVATLAESEWIPEIQHLVETILQRVNLRGFANIEFKFHPDENKYYLIEINTRVWQQIDFAAACGLRFTDYFYSDMTGAPVRFDDGYQYPKRWISPYSDALSFLDKMKNKEASLLSFFSSYKNAVSFSLFDTTDLHPALYDIEYGFKVIKAPFKLLGKLLH